MEENYEEDNWDIEDLDQADNNDKKQENSLKQEEDVINNDYNDPELNNAKLDINEEEHEQGLNNQIPVIGMEESPHKNIAQDQVEVIEKQEQNENQEQQKYNKGLNGLITKFASAANNSQVNQQQLDDDNNSDQYKKQNDISKNSLEQYENQERTSLQNEQQQDDEMEQFNQQEKLINHSTVQYQGQQQSNQDFNNDDYGQTNENFEQEQSMNKYNQDQEVTEKGYSSKVDLTFATNIKDDGLDNNKIDAERFQAYLDKTGLGFSFQCIFAEIMSKKIKSSHVFSYTVMRLRQIGSDLDAIKEGKK